MVGRMRFRSSYGQNLLMHSRETANLCAIMAAELGMNPKLLQQMNRLHGDNNARAIVDSARTKVPGV